MTFTDYMWKFLIDTNYINVLIYTEKHMRVQVAFLIFSQQTDMKLWRDAENHQLNMLCRVV